MRALEQGRVSYVLVGTLAGVLRGTPETTDLVEICPQTKTENMIRLESALEAISATSAGTNGSAHGDIHDARLLDTNHGRLRIEPIPIGTTGYDDLRRQARRELLDDRGLRVSVASLSDLLRVLRARGLPEEVPRIRMYRRLLEMTREHERSLGIGR